MIFSRELVICLLYGVVLAMYNHNLFHVEQNVKMNIYHSISGTPGRNVDVDMYTEKIYHGEQNVTLNFKVRD